MTPLRNLFGMYALLFHTFEIFCIFQTPQHNIFIFTQSILFENPQFTFFIAFFYFKSFSHQKLYSGPMYRDRNWIYFLCKTIKNGQNIQKISRLVIMQWRTLLTERWWIHELNPTVAAACYLERVSMTWSWKGEPKWNILGEE